MRRLGAVFLIFVLILGGCGVPAQAPSGASTASPTVSVPVSEPPTENTVSADSSFSIQFIDVGQADGTLVQCDGQYMLIDGGNTADSSLIYSVLKRSAVQVLELVVGTHAHEDHIGGLPGAFQWTSAKRTLCPVKSYDSEAFGNFSRYAEEKGGGITVPMAGDTYQLGSAVVTILGVNSGSSTNDSSIILRIDYGDTSFLFTGDGEREAETALINAGANVKATVLKVGHHGSDTSTGYRFLREVMPRYGVISCGKNNSYGHPAEAVLSRLRDAEVTLFRTDMQGDIFCTSDGRTVTFHVEKNLDGDTLGPAGGQEEEPNAEYYVLNTASGKFHRPDCSGAMQIAPENRQDVEDTRDGLMAQGYSPCKRCRP